MGSCDTMLGRGRPSIVSFENLSLENLELAGPLLDAEELSAEETRSLKAGKIHEEKDEPFT